MVEDSARYSAGPGPGLGWAGGAAPGWPAAGPCGGECCCRCARRASPLTCLAVCFLVLTYNLLGGFLFLALEGGAPQESAAAASQPEPAAAAEPAPPPAPLTEATGAAALRARTVDRLWSITEDLNILYKENWTKLAAKELMDFQRVLVETVKGGSTFPSVDFDRDGDYRWTFSGSFLYALTLITTIGHGNVTPKSSIGKMVAMAYACIGIPIIMLYLSTVGEALARNFRALYARLRPAPRLRPARKQEPPAHPPRTPFQAALELHALGAGRRGAGGERVPVALSLLLLALYVALGALVFRATEKWDFVDGCFFSFSSLATVGFGALRPGRHAGAVSARAEDAALGVCCAYILVGVLVVAMCFNLIQTELRAAARAVHAAS